MVRPKTGWFWAALVLCLAAGCALAYAAMIYVQGTRGELRPFVYAFGWAVVALTYSLDPGTWARRLRLVVLGGFLLLALDLVTASPGCETWGRQPAFPNDFNINRAGAQALYAQGTSPYFLNQNLPNTSNSFPFPSYLLYHAASLGGNLGPKGTGVVFLGLNLIAAVGLVWASLGLSCGTREHLEPLVILAAGSPMFGVIMNGQTPLISAALFVTGFWWMKRGAPSAIWGAPLIVLGVMIKPNFLVAVWPVVFIADRPPIWRKAIWLGLAALVCVGGTLAWPGGVTADTYYDFFTKISFVLQAKFDAHNNLSLLKILFGLGMSLEMGSVLSIAGLVAGIVVGHLRRWPWPYWLILPLMIMPITWPGYMVLLLPAFFAWAVRAQMAGRPEWLVALALIQAFFFIPKAPVALVGFGLCMVMLVTIHREEALGRAGDSGGAEYVRANR